MTELEIKQKELGVKYWDLLIKTLFTIVAGLWVCAIYVKEANEDNRRRQLESDRRGVERMIAVVESYGVVRANCDPDFGGLLTIQFTASNKDSKASPTRDSRRTACYEGYMALTKSILSANLYVEVPTKMEPVLSDKEWRDKWDASWKALYGVNENLGVQGYTDNNATELADALRALVKLQGKHLAF